MARQIADNWKPVLEFCPTKQDIRVNGIAKAVEEHCLHETRELNGLSLSGRFCLTEQAVGNVCQNSISFDCIDRHHCPQVPDDFNVGLFSGLHSNEVNLFKKQFPGALHTKETASYKLTGYLGEFTSNLHWLQKRKNYDFVYFDGCGNAINKSENTVAEIVRSMSKMVRIAPVVYAVTFNTNCRNYGRYETIKALTGLEPDDMPDYTIMRSGSNYIPKPEAVADAIQQFIINRFIELTNGNNDIAIVYRKDYQQENSSSPMVTMVFVINPFRALFNMASYHFQQFNWPKKFYQYRSCSTIADFKANYKRIAERVATRTKKTGKELGEILIQYLPIHPWQAASMAAWFHPNLKKYRKKT